MKMFRTGLINTLRELHSRTSGAKALIFIRAFPARLKAVPLQTIYEISSRSVPNRFQRKLRFARAFAGLCGLLLAAIAPTDSFCSAARAQQTEPAPPVVVQPGA